MITPSQRPASPEVVHAVLELALTMGLSDVSKERSVFVVGDGERVQALWPWICSRARRPATSTQPETIELSGGDSEAWRCPVAARKGRVLEIRAGSLLDLEVLAARITEQTNAWAILAGPVVRVFRQGRLVGGLVSRSEGRPRSWPISRN